MQLHCDRASRQCRLRSCLQQLRRPRTGRSMLSRQPCGLAAAMTPNALCVATSLVNLLLRQPSATRSETTLSNWQADVLAQGKQHAAILASLCMCAWPQRGHWRCCQLADTAQYRHDFLVCEAHMRVHFGVLRAGQHDVADRRKEVCHHVHPLDQDGILQHCTHYVARSTLPCARIDLVVVYNCNDDHESLCSVPACTTSCSSLPALPLLDIALDAFHTLAQRAMLRHLLYLIMTSIGPSCWSYKHPE